MQLVIDATHLKGTDEGDLFVESTKDANKQIVSLTTRRMISYGSGSLTMYGRVLDPQRIYWLFLINTVA